MCILMVATVADKVATTEVATTQTIAIKLKGSGGNKKLPCRRIPTVGIVKYPNPNTTIPQTLPPWWCHLPLLLRSVIYGYARSDVGNLFLRGRARVRTTMQYNVTESTAIGTAMPPGRYGARHITLWIILVASC